MESAHAERDITPEISDFKTMTSLSPPGHTLYFASEHPDLNNAFVTMLPSFLYIPPTQWATFIFEWL